jgi:hypothetical protein
VNGTARHERDFKSDRTSILSGEGDWNGLMETVVIEGTFLSFDIRQDREPCSSDGGGDQSMVTMHRSLTLKNILGVASDSDGFVTCGADCFLCVWKRTRDGEVPDDQSDSSYRILDNA